jgi:hypothetical protein
LIGQIKTILILLAGSLLAACTDEPSNQTIPERLISASAGYAVTHYGYVGEIRYEASVASDELRDTDTIELAMPPREAVNLALPALKAAGEDLRDYVVCGVDLTRHVHTNQTTISWHFVGKIRTTLGDFGFRFCYLAAPSNRRIRPLKARCDVCLCLAGAKCRGSDKLPLLTRRRHS